MLQLQTKDIPDTYHYKDVLVADINEVLADCEELSCFIVPGETDKYVVVKGGVYFESDDLDTGHEIEIVLVFTEGYPLEEPLIYLPSLRNTSDISPDGKLTTFPKNWASSPILMELIAELFDYIAQLLEPSDKDKTSPSICDPGSFSKDTTPESAAMDKGTDISSCKILRHSGQDSLQLIDTEHQQFSSPSVVSSLTHDREPISPSPLLVGESDKLKHEGFKDGVNPTSTSSDPNSASESQLFVEFSQFETDEISASSTSLTAKEGFVRINSELGSGTESDCKPSCFEIVQFYKERIQDEISCLNSDYLALLEETENAVDFITDIQHEINKCKYEIVHLQGAHSKSSKVKSLANLPIDEQVRASETVHLKAKVCAINDALSILILALSRNTIHMKEFLEKSSLMGREKFLLKYTLKLKFHLKSVKLKEGRRYIYT
ncbi:hypothetical protein ACHWQZ_G004649 [Mnemiopsis leidyi]